MPIVNPGSVALAKLIGKNVKRLLVDMKSLSQHMKVMKKLVSEPVIHRNATQKLALDALKRVKSAREQASKLWLSIGKATEKLPKDQRKSMRREVENLLKQLEKEFEAVEKGAIDLVREIDRLEKNKIIDTPAEGALQVTATALQAIITAWKGWKTLRKRNFK